MNKLTKRQHFVPRTYLKRFTFKGDSIWCFSREGNSIFSSSIEDICVSRYFYETPNVLDEVDTSDISDALLEEGLTREEFLRGFKFIQPNYVENKLGNDMENNIDIVFNPIIELSDQHNASLIDASRINRNELSKLILLQHFRGPAMRARFDEMVLPDEPGPRDKKTSAQNHSLALLGFSNQDFESEVFSEVITKFNKGNFYILKAPGEASFLTSDEPVIIDYESEQRTLGEGLFDIYFPISSRVYVNICHHEIQKNINFVSVIDRECLNWLNYQQVKSSFRHVFASSKGAIDDLLNQLTTR